MTDDIFRIVIAAAVGLACLAFLVQAGVAIALYGVTKKMQQKFASLADRAEPVIANIDQTVHRVGPVIDAARPVIQRIGPMVDKVVPVVEKIGPVVDRAGMVLATTNRILEENRPRVAELSKEAVEIVKTGRQHLDRIGTIVTKAGETARNRIEQIDHTVDNTIHQVEQVGETVKRTVMRPVREVNGLAAGISAAVSTLVKGSRKSSVESATQDEEMFI
jgi:ABC-type transporter Mla subunit MlaD